MGWLGTDGRRRPAFQRGCSAACGAASSCARTCSGSSPSISPPRPPPGAGGGRGVHRLGRWPGVRRRVELDPHRDPVRALPLHRGDRGAGAVPRRTSRSWIPLSFTFLAYASLLPGRAAPRRRTGRLGPAVGARLRLAGLAGLLMMLLDVVIDPAGGAGRPLVPRPDLLLPGAGWYFGVPLRTSPAGCSSGRRSRGAGPSSALASAARGLLGRALAGARAPGGGPLLPRAGLQPGDHGGGGRAALFWAGVLLHVPLAVVVVCSLRSREPAGRVPRVPASP